MYQRKDRPLKEKAPHLGGTVRHGELSRRTWDVGGSRRQETVAAETRGLTAHGAADPGLSSVTRTGGEGGSQTTE